MNILVKGPVSALKLKMAMEQANISLSGVENLVCANSGAFNALKKDPLLSEKVTFTPMKRGMKYGITLAVKNGEAENIKVDFVFRFDKAKRLVDFSKIEWR